MNDLLSESAAFVFDLDGTIVDNCRYHVLAWQMFSGRIGRPLTEEQILGWMGATNRTYLERILGRPVTDEEARRFEDEKESLYRERYAPHMKLAPGLRDLLDYAGKKGVPCAVASGAPRQNIDFILDGLSIRGDFACAVDASMYTRGKPAPDCFLTAARMLGADPAGCLVFEDAVGGVRAAREAGMRSVALAGTTASREDLVAAGADLVIGSFAELRLPTDAFPPSGRR